MGKTFTIKAKGYPDLPAMMFATVKALREIGSSASLHELDEKVIETEDISENEQEFTMPNDSRRKVNYFLAWARTYLKRGGVLDNSKKGIWSLTSEHHTIKSLSDTKKIYDRVQTQERQSRKERLSKDQDKVPVDPVSTTKEIDDGAINESWRSALMATLNVLSPDAFERLTQRIMREAGFTKVDVRGKIGDQGIDGVGVLRVNLVSFQVYFQCKRWRGSVGAREIRDFRGALQGRADKGLFITTGSFTSQASEEATRDGAIAIDLIDGDRLCDLLKQYELGVSTEMKEVVTVAEDWFRAI